MEYFQLLGKVVHAKRAGLRYVWMIIAALAFGYSIWTRQELTNDYIEAINEINRLNNLLSNCN